jgi:von Willebrand factor type A domain/Aerotolerance regulator N-terminal
LHLTFLSPFPALIAAAISLPALLVLYFLKLRRRPVRVSSTLLWEQATRGLQVNVPFRFIRPSWLLLLQLLILAAFLLALARPALNMGAGTPEKVILVIDRSASMNARDGAAVSAPRAGAATPPSTRLEEAKARALRALEELTQASSGSSFAVIELAAEPRLVAPFTQDRDALRSTIESIEPSDQPGDLLATLRLCSAMLTGEASESTRSRPGLVMLFSDGAFPPAAEGYTLTGAQFRYQRIGAPPTTGASVDAGRDNVGIVALSARRDWDDPALVRLFVRVRSARAAPLAVPLVLSVDGTEVDRKAIEVPGAAALEPPPSSGTQPAETTATFALTRREGGIVTISIDRPDLLDADNSASLVLDAATKPQILLVTPDQPAAPTEIAPGQPSQPPRAPEWIITDVIHELKLPMRVMSASLFEREMASQSPPAPDLVIFDRVRATRVPAAPSISFGAGLPIGGLTLDPPAPDSPGTYVLSWQRTHPLLRDVALDTVFIARPMTLHAAPGAPPVTEIARGNAGPPIAVVDDRGTRRIIVAFELAYSNWPLNVGFPIFISQAIDYLTMHAADRAGTFATTSQPADILVPTGTRRVVLAGPQRLERTLGEGEPTPSGLRRVSLGVLEHAGVYRVEGVPHADGTAAPAPSIAVNLLDETESSLAVADQLRVSGQTVAGAGPGQEPLELWPYLVAAALVILTIEWFLNAWSMKV